MLYIDGSFGEGGGQIIRTCLALSVITGKAFTIKHIRAGRSKPGLLRQHLTAVRAAAKVGGAVVTGDALGSQEFIFEPQLIRPGEYIFSIGSAGSAGLVLQTVLPPLLMADGPSRLVLEGGTHNAWAPPYHFLEQVFVPVLNRMGSSVSMNLEHYGFYPAGGGRFTVEISPGGGLKPLELIERGEIVGRQVIGIASGIPEHIPAAEVSAVQKQLDWPKTTGRVEMVDSVGPGNAVMIKIQAEYITELVTAFGKRGKRLQRVAAEAAEGALRYLQAEVPVSEHLADQLMLPMALAGGGRYRTLSLTQHSLTNIATIQTFLAVEIHTNVLKGGIVEVCIG